MDPSIARAVNNQREYTRSKERWTLFHILCVIEPRWLNRPGHWNVYFFSISIIWKGNRPCVTQSRAWLLQSNHVWGHSFPHILRLLFKRVSNKVSPGLLGLTFLLIDSLRVRTSRLVLGNIRYIRRHWRKKKWLILDFSRPKVGSINFVLVDCVFPFR